MIDRIYELGRIKQATLIFFTGFITRLLLTILFINKYGPHATRGELWHWVAAAEGKALLNPLDPTKLLFDVTRIFFGGELFPYGLMLLAMIASSFCGVIIYFIVSELFDKKTAFTAGFLYVLMTESIYSSVANFIHDLVVLPLILLSILSFILFSKKGLGLWERLIYLISFFSFTWFTYNASKEVYVLFGLFILFIVYTIFNFISEKLGLGRDKSYPFFVFTALFLSLISAAFFGGRVFDEIFGLMSQGRYGSQDIVPLTLETFWGRTLLFIFFLPAGLLTAFRRKDNLFMALFFYGLLISFFVSRGTRIMDVGAAVLVAHALVSWKKQWIMPSALIYSVFLFTVLATSVFDFDYFLFNHLPSIALSLAFILTYMRYGNENRFLILFLIAALFMGYIACIEKATLSDISSEGEYVSLKWLSTQAKEGDKVLISWDRGDMASVVANVTPISNYDRISMKTHNMLWYPEDCAASELRKRGVVYVVVTSRDFSSFIEGGEIRFILGSLIFKDKENLTATPITNSSIYKLRYTPHQTTEFTPINAVSDSRSGTNILIYRIKEVAKAGDMAT